MDLEKAFDRVPREKMWKVIADTGISSKLFMAIKSTYKDQQSAVIGDTNYFTINTGVRQGSVLSPLLFIIYLNHVMINVTREDYRAECFGCALDVGHTADSREILQDIMNQWDRAGLKLSYAKTEYMEVGREPEEGDITVIDHVLKKDKQLRIPRQQADFYQHHGRRNQQQNSEIHQKSDCTLPPHERERNT